MTVDINITEAEARKLPPDKVSTVDNEGSKSYFEVRHEGLFLEVWQTTNSEEITFYYATVYDPQTDSVSDLEYANSNEPADNYASVDASDEIVERAWQAMDRKMRSAAAHVGLSPDSVESILAQGKKLNSFLHVVNAIDTAMASAT